MRIVAAWLLLLASLCPAFASEHTVSLLLTPRLVRRLTRDQTRQTVRWQNFEKRVQTVPDSPERGFELALYYVITHDADRGREAIAWALAHRSEARQVALVLDWTANLLTPDQIRQLGAISAQNPRDRLFLAIATGRFDREAFQSTNRQIIEQLKNVLATDPAGLYSATEYLMAYRAATRTDLRETDPLYFTRLPKVLLLDLSPQLVEHPDWMAHLGALALVTLDPNLENSQFLQGWAMEDRQMLREGPGVAYELLWADPYLPGIAFENMDPWVYDPAGFLLARTDWSSNACWIRIGPSKQDQQNCDESKFTQAGQFGTLTLMRLAATCAAVPPHKNRESLMLWKLPPLARLDYEYNSQHIHARTDAAGLWPVPNDTSGKLCLLN